MTTKQLEKELLQNTKGLPEEVLQEVIDFIQFIKKKRMKRKDNNLTAELSLLSTSQTSHLEEEFQDYKEIYPSE